MFGLEPNAGEYIRRRWNSLIRFDEIRLNEILESLQYGLGYLIVAFMTGIGLDYLFPQADENKETWKTGLEVLAQALALIIVAFYLRKLVKIVPFFLYYSGSGRPTFRAHESSEYQGEFMMSVIFISVQDNLLKKVNILSDRIYSMITNKFRPKPILAGQMVDKATGAVVDGGFQAKPQVQAQAPQQQQQPSLLHQPTRDPTRDPMDLIRPMVYSGSGQLY